MLTEVVIFSVEAAFPQAEPTGFAFGDFWSLTQQAGPLRWPIFVVLAIGLTQVFMKLWELVRDRRVSTALREVDLSTRSLPEIVALVEAQEEGMLATLQSTMLNVFQTRPAEGMLHDEISNFVNFQQDQFGVFQRRMEFLSDTAGALGLMGTVWGMFTVFFQGTAEQDVILRGMGIALITTLLGLVVSIILNFSATELSTFFNRRLEQVSRKSDELRFRLMELAPVAPVAAPAAAPAVARTEPKVAEGKAGGTAAPVQAIQPQQPAAKAAPAWRYVEMLNGHGPLRAGDVAKDLAVLVRNADGSPAPNVPVLVAVAGEGGELERGERSLRRKSDAKGRVEFSCTLPEAVGPFELEVSLPEQPGPAQRLVLTVRSALPERIEITGNHQAAVAGMRLPLPLAVSAFDRFGNPVAGVPVSFGVKEGEGKLGSGTKANSTQTDSKGRAVTVFVVSSQVGPNVVTAKIDGFKKPVEFVAYGTEV